MNDFMNVPNNAATHETISTHAYALWEQAGRPTGRDGEFWLQAEQELKAPGAAVTAKPPPLATSPPPPPAAPPRQAPPVIGQVGIAPRKGRTRASSSRRKS